MPDRVRRVFRPTLPHHPTGDDAHKPQSPATPAAEGRRREKRLLAELKPYPLQQEYFRDLPDAALRELADNIDLQGLRQLIEILPNNTIVSGHQRKRALDLLGRAEVTVLVRYDLEKAGPKAVEAYFLEANDLRRQLGQLERLGVIMRRFELEPRGSARRGQGELREEIAAKMHVTGRHFGRLVKLLALPPALRHAYDDHRLTLANATRCLALSKSQWSQVEQALLNGADVTSVIASLANNDKSSAPRLANSLPKIRRQFLQFGQKLAREIIDNPTATASYFRSSDERTLREIHRAVTRVIQQMENGDI